MGLISNGGENLLDFLELRQVLSTYDGDIRDPLWWPQERPVPLRVARGPLGFLLPSMLGQRVLAAGRPHPYGWARRLQCCGGKAVGGRQVSTEHRSSVNLSQCLKALWLQGSPLRWIILCSAALSLAWKSHVREMPCTRKLLRIHHPFPSLPWNVKCPPENI